MNQKKQIKFLPFYAGITCFLFLFLLFQTNVSSKFPTIAGNSESASISELQELPILVPGQLDGTFSNNVIRTLSKTSLQKATIFPSLRDCYFSILILKTSLSTRPGNFYSKIFNTSIFGNAPWIIDLRLISWWFKCVDSNFFKWHISKYTCYNVQGVYNR